MLLGLFAEKSSSFTKKDTSASKLPCLIAPAIHCRSVSKLPIICVSYRKITLKSIQIALCVVRDDPPKLAIHFFEVIPAKFTDAHCGDRPIKVSIDFGLPALVSDYQYVSPLAVFI